MSVFDQKIDTDEWITLLTELGVPRQEFTPEMEILGKASHIHQHTATFNANPTGYNRAAARIVGNPADYDAVIGHAIEAATATDTGRREAVAKTLALAVEMIHADYAATFRRRGSSLISLLAPIYEKASKEAAKAWKALPSGVRNIEQAGKLGAAQTWLGLEKASVTIGNVAALLGAWTRAGILAPGTSRSAAPVPTMFMFKDYAAAIEAHARYSGLAARRAGAAAATASPHLVDPATIDVGSLRNHDLTPQEKSALAHRQKNADERDYTAAVNALPTATRLRNSRRVAA
jgi:hypothetical protein